MQRSRPRLSKASRKKTCLSEDPFLEGLGISQDFSQGPVLPPDPEPVSASTRQPFGEPFPPGYVHPYEVIHEKGSTPAKTETAAMGILRTAARGMIGVWYLLNRQGKQWRRARWFDQFGVLTYRVEEIRNGKIEYHSQEGIPESDDIGI